MSKAAEKPLRLTESVIDEYLSTKEQLAEAQKALKPLKDLEKQQSDAILNALLMSGASSKKCGRHRVALVEKPGSVSWKTECVKRCTAEELAALEAAAELKITLQIQTT